MAVTDRAKRRIVARVERALQIPSDRQRLVEVEQQVQRQAAQLAALEVRLADLQERERTPAGVGADAQTEGSLVEEARREHERVRLRMAMVTNYLARLERLEEALDLPPQPGARV